jgi:predicted Zn finger-like uncharacterized protein
MIRALKDYHAPVMDGSCGLGTVFCPTCFGVPHCVKECRKREFLVSNSLTDRLVGLRSLVRPPRFAMLIVCPNCATSYQLEPSSLGPGGRSVRCARCQNQWFAAIPTVVPALATVDDFDIVDNGPRIPAFDATPPRFEPIPEPEPEPEPQIVPEFEELAVEAQDSPQIAAAPEGEPAETTAEDLPLESASTEGIDVEGLSTEMETERAEHEAVADRVLAEVTGEVPVAEAPPLVPALEPGRGPDQQTIAPDADAAADIETFAARRARRAALRRGRRWPIPGIAAAILALVAVDTMLVGWRNDVVRLLPQTASLYATLGIPVNLRGLAFENIKMSREAHDGVTVLVVEGSIVNVTGKAVEVPRLRLAVRNESKNEIYTWTTLPARSVLGPAETLPFRSRLASPPPEARDVLLRFFGRRDLVAGLH